MYRFRAPRAPSFGCRQSCTRTMYTYTIIISINQIERVQRIFLNFAAWVLEIMNHHLPHGHEPCTKEIKSFFSSG